MVLRRRLSRGPPTKQVAATRALSITCSRDVSYLPGRGADCTAVSVLRWPSIRDLPPKRAPSEAEATLATIPYIVAVVFARAAATVYPRNA